MLVKSTDRKRLKRRLSEVARTKASESSIEIERRVKIRVKNWIEKCMIFVLFGVARTSET